MDDFRQYLPISGSSSPVKRGLMGLLSRNPFVLGFLGLSWPVFLVLVEATGKIPAAIQDNIGFIAVQWAERPWEAVISSNVGILVQHSWGQLIYITAILLVGGIAYERREGPLRTMLVFYGACIVGISTITLLLLALPILGEWGWWQHLYENQWSGASVGSFGVLGAYVALARNPWPLLGAFALYEYLVEWSLVPGLVIVMHGLGFLFGFTISRIAHLDDASLHPLKAKIGAKDPQPVPAAE